MPNDQFNVLCQQKNSNSLENTDQVIVVYDTDRVLAAAAATSAEGQTAGGDCFF